MEYTTVVVRAQGSVSWRTGDHGKISPLKSQYRGGWGSWNARALFLMHFSLPRTGPMDSLVLIIHIGDMIIRIAGGAGDYWGPLSPTCMATRCARSASGGMSTRTATGAGTWRSSGICLPSTCLCVAGARVGIWLDWGLLGIRISWNATSCMFAGYSRRRLGGAGTRSRGMSAIASRASSRSCGGRNGDRLRVSRKPVR